MKVVIIGGVAAGPKAASRINRLSADAEVTIVEKGEFLSYAGCGLPYYISGKVSSQEDLRSTPVGTVRDSVFFHNVKNVNILNHTEATAIDRDAKTVTVRGSDGAEQLLPYDKLIIATGAAPAKPPIPGIDHKNIFGLKSIEDAEAIKAKLAEKKALDTVIVGGGLIGVEVAEAFSQMGCRVTIVEFLPQILSLIDPDMIQSVEAHFESKGVKICTSTRVTAFDGDDNGVKTVVTDNGVIPADVVIMAVGVRPEVTLAQMVGITIGETGAIQVNAQMQTSDDAVYAVGDCAEKINLITGKPAYVPLGSTANKEGRVAANAICGIPDQFPGILGSAVCKVFDFTVGRTGLGEQEAREAGFDVVTALAPAPDRPHFMPEAKLLMLKLIADRKSRRLLGAQATGPGVADKRIDVAATAISASMTVDQLANLDLCYAPPYSPAIDNILTAANVLRNKLDGLMSGITAREVRELGTPGTDFTFLDVRTPAELEQVSLPGALHIPLGALRGKTDQVDRSKPIIAFCKISLRGYEAALILKNAGFEDVRVMDGGVVMWPYEKVVS